jgi:NADPH:quinone reductase-like Zn-dependent oxidoreductase
MLTKVVRFHEFGGPEVLRFDSLEVGEPGAGEVRVRVVAIGLNRAEAAFRAGRYIERAVLPARLGYEAAGVVEALGEGVKGYSVDEQICVMPSFSMNKYGVYAERAILPASALLKRPARLGTNACASIWMQYLTAYGALIDISQIGAGDAVIITAASSSVGIAAIQIANHAGAISIAVTRTAAKESQLRKLGAAHVIVSEKQTLEKEVLRVTGDKGAKVAFDPIAGPIVASLAAAMARGGRLILYGNLSGEAQSTIFPFGLSLSRGFSMRAYVVFEIISDPQRFEKARLFVEEGLRDGWLKPVIAKTFPFDQMVEAHRYMEGNEQIGKVIVTVP